MKKIIFVGVIAAVLTSCASATYPGVATGNQSLKTGIAEKKVWFGTAKTVDLGIVKAAQNGGITKVATVDYQIKYGFFNTTYKTIVTGE